MRLSRAIDPDSEISKQSLLYNVKWFISLRWLAAVAIFAVTFFSRNVVGVNIEHKVFYSIGFIILFYNLIIFYWYRYSQKGCSGDTCIKNAIYSAHTQIVLDLIALGFLIHFSGGVESPFLYVFIFHPIFASIILSMRSAIFYAFLTIVITGFIAIAEGLRLIDHHHISEFFSSENVYSFLFSAGTFFAFAVIQFTAVIITIVIMRDLRKKQVVIERIKRELEEKNERLKKKDEMRLLFLASATHDLKSPLNTITSYIQSILDGYFGAVTEEQKRILQRIQKRIGGLRQLISDILILGEYETEEKRELRREVFDIIKLISESIEEFSAAADERGIEITFEKAVESCPVFADPLKIDEVIHNYISNAIKYNRDNGKVVVKAEIVSDMIRVSVADTGIGIKKEEIERLFTDFFRSGEVKKSGIEGTGLGLSIVKRIIEGFGGRVWAESEYQKGSVFYFELPIFKS